jgi:hypothetical protein
MQNGMINVVMRLFFLPGEYERDAFVLNKSIWSIKAIKMIEHYAYLHRTAI